jgi:GR25 family glycosyltransferase involved in LPS biosynthesis
VDGKTLDLLSDRRISIQAKRNIKMNTRRSHEDLNSIGGVGCALSHIAIWKWMVDQEQEMCIIFEDDAKVPPNFCKMANDCIKGSTILSNPRSWDLWLLGGECNDLTSIPSESKDSGVVRVGSFVLFHAYVMTLHAAKRLLQEVYPIQCHMDKWTSLFSSVYDLRVVFCQKMNLLQNYSFKSEIQTGKQCHICDVPDDFEKKYTMVAHNDWIFAQACEVVVAGLIVYHVYHWIRK